MLRALLLSCLLVLALPLAASSVDSSDAAQAPTEAASPAKAAGPVLSVAAAVGAGASASTACGFVLGFSALHDELVNVGDCREDQHSTADGDAEQATTGGLLVWRKADNWTAFTDGYRTWINGPRGLVERLNTERFDWEVTSPAAGAAIYHVLSPGPMVQTAGARASIGPLIHITQTLNNCGPASVAEVLHYWGIDRSQDELNRILRHGNPYGMSTDDVASYVPTIGMQEYIGNHGSQAVLKTLIANGFPVIVSQFVSLGDRETHFRPLEAYDDMGQRFIASDPLLGDSYSLSYQAFDQLWTPYDHTFLVIFPPAKRAMLQAVIASSGFGGPSWITPA